MALLSFTNAHLAFGHHALLDAAAFSLLPSERVGLIGRNGTGKSSLLRVLAGMESLDDGDVQQQQDLNIVYTQQEPDLPHSGSVFEAAYSSMCTLRELLDRYATALSEGAQTDAIDIMQAQIERLDGWNWENRVRKALQLFQVHADAPVGKLSGGGRKRVALALAYAAKPDIWLLDEPTNHLDVDAIVLLQEVLNGFNGSCVVISHDRSFLDAVCTRIVELDRGVLRSYPGNFARYQELKAQQLEQEAVINARKDRLLAQEELWIRQGVEARRTRSQSRIRQLHALRAERAERRNPQGNIRLDVDSGERSGKMVAELRNADKAFGEKIIARNLSLTVMRGDKIGIVGANGAGKTTLVNMMLGLEPADAGHIRTGSNLQVVYFDQLRTHLDLNLTLEDAISPGSEWIEINGRKQHVKSYLADFLFPPQRAASPVATLSGGERSRLLLARLFARPANVLVLDEPTNDLDIETIELLEELLHTYPGTVFLISHDRRFLNNVVTGIIAHEPLAEKPGSWLTYEGNAEDWMTQRARMLNRQRNDTGMQTASDKNRPGSPSSPPDTPHATLQSAPTPGRKLRYREQQELNQLPEKIQQLEDEQAELLAVMEEGSVFAADPQKAARITARHAAIEQELMHCLERWDALEKIAAPQPKKH